MQIVQEVGGAVPKKRQLACTECRKRKQKCSHGNPCSGCARRFPQPICRYPSSQPASSPTETQTHVRSAPSRGDAEDASYMHSKVGDMTEAVSENFSTSEEPKSTNVLRLRNLGLSRKVVFSQNDGNWASRTHTPLLVKPNVHSRTGTKSTVMIDTLTRILEHRCHIAEQALQNARTLVETREQRPVAALQAEAPSAPIGDIVDYMNLPMESSDMNKELVRLHLQILSRFKVAVDGSPSPGNQYLEQWLPFTLHNPLLLQIVLFTSASYLNERGSAPERVVLKLKAEAYRRLNKHIDTHSLQADDVAIMAVSQLIMDSWYWGAHEEVHAHIKGLKQMIGLRGGLQNLGLQGFLAKTILIHDMSMALAHQTKPQMYGLPGFYYEEPVQMAENGPFESPLMLNSIPGLVPESSTPLEGSTDFILYNMKATLRSVLADQHEGDFTSGEWLDLRSFNQIPERSTEPSVGLLCSEGLPAADGRYNNHNSSWHPKPLDPHSGTTNVPQSMPSDSLECPHMGETEPSMSYGDTAEVEMRPCIREISSIYHQAIAVRRPTSEILSPERAMQVWNLVWQIPLNRWKKAIGIFIWAMIAIVPSIHTTKYARFVKTMLVVGMMTVSMENWNAAIEAATTALKLQQWLKESSKG